MARKPIRPLTSPQKLTLLERRVDKKRVIVVSSTMGQSALDELIKDRRRTGCGDIREDACPGYGQYRCTVSSAFNRSYRYQQNA